MPDDRGRILIVEDNSTDVELITHALTAGGIGNPIDIAKDSLDALVVIRERVPVLMLIDLTLPGMDGLELIRKVRSYDDFGLLPIIVVTGSSNPADREASLKVGANGYMSKPVYFDQLHQELLKLGLRLYIDKRTAA